jgi:Zn finger protein HypA/HybF involved in hydrogenase expression
MHELGIMTGVMESVEEAARNAGATKVLEIDLSVGVMTEAVEDALRFAFEALSEGTMCEGADFKINMIQRLLGVWKRIRTRPLPRNVPPVRKWIHTAYCWQRNADRLNRG